MSDARLWWNRQKRHIQNVKSGFLAIQTPFEFHQAVLKYLLAIKSIWLKMMLLKSLKVLSRKQNQSLKHLFKSKKLKGAR